jgi:glycosyltransferase involved in cell wall biosynthesis
MNIAVVSETYPPEINGVSLFMHRVVEALAKSHAVELIRPKQSGPSIYAASDHLAEILVPGMPLPRYQGLRFGLPVKRLIARAWTRQRPEVVHISTEGPLGWAALAAANEMRIPVVADYHTHFPRYCAHYGLAWLTQFAVRYLRRFHNKAWCTVVPSQSTLEDLEQLGFHNIRVIERGVDTHIFNPDRRSETLRASWGVAPDDPVVIYVGRIAAEKNLPQLVDSFYAIRQRHPRAKLVLVGDGPMTEPLRHKFPEFVFCGFKTGPELGEHYASGDLFLFPSMSETFGNVVTEAMASGLAVVAYDYAAARQHIRHEVSGLLVPYNDGAAFTRTAVELAGDANRIATLRKAAVQSIAAVTWEHILDQFESLLEEAVSDSKNKRAGQV